MAQQAKQLESEAVSPFDKFKDLAKRLFNVSKGELSDSFDRDKPDKKPFQKESRE